MADFDSGDELCIEWTDIYLIVDHNDKRPMVMFEPAKSLKKGQKCLAITFVGNECKFAKGLYRAATLLKKMNSKIKISYQDCVDEDGTVFDKTVRIKNDIFPSVIKILPASKSMQLILMKNSLQTKPTNEMPSPSASPTVSPSPVLFSQDASTIVAEFNEHMFQKTDAKSSKSKLKTKRANKLIAGTVTKAQRSISPNKKTAINYSVKYLFCIISENNPKSSYNEIHRQLKAKGYKVGKGSCVGEWAKKGSNYWFRLLQEKGDGAKYVFCICEQI